MPDGVLLSQGQGQFGPARALRGQTGRLVPLGAVPAYRKAARRSQEKAMLTGTCLVVVRRRTTDANAGTIWRERVMRRYKCRLMVEGGGGEREAGAGLQPSAKYTLRLPFMAALATKDTLRVFQDGADVRVQVTNVKRTTNALLLIADVVDSSGKVD